MKRLLIALLPAILMVGLLASPSAAVGTEDPRFGSPTGQCGAGSCQGYGAPGPNMVTINLASSPVGDYAVSVRSIETGAEYKYDEVISYDGSGDGWKIVYIPQLTGLGLYEATVTHVGDTATSSTVRFMVVPSFDDPTAAPMKFYPHVTDGYRDATRVSTHLYGTTEVLARVRNANGTVIRREALGLQEEGPLAWSWDGRNNAGNVVAPANYTVSFHADYPADSYMNGGTDSQSATVTVAKGFKTYSATKSRDGYDNTSQATRGNCSIEWGYWNDWDAFLDCWGGRYALARYRFAIPANATDITYAVGGRAHCCDSSGVIRKTRTRPTPTSTVVQVKVTGWRSYQINWVSISYKYRKAI